MFSESHFHYHCKWKKENDIYFTYLFIIYLYKLIEHLHANQYKIFYEMFGKTKQFNCQDVI